MTSSLHIGGQKARNLSNKVLKSLSNEAEAVFYLFLLAKKKKKT